MHELKQRFEHCFVSIISKLNNNVNTQFQLPVYLFNIDYIKQKLGLTRFYKCITIIQKGRWIEALNSIQGQMSDMNNKTDRLSDQITKVELHNVTDKSIGLLMEPYNPNVEKLDDVINKVDEIQFDLGGIKRVVISHSKDINNLLKK